MDLAAEPAANNAASTRRRNLLIAQPQKRHDTARETCDSVDKAVAAGFDKAGVQALSVLLVPKLGCKCVSEGFKVHYTITPMLQRLVPALRLEGILKKEVQSASLISRLVEQQEFTLREIAEDDAALAAKISNSVLNVIIPNRHGTLPFNIVPPVTSAAVQAIFPGWPGDIPWEPTSGWTPEQHDRFGAAVVREFAAAGRLEGILTNAVRRGKMAAHEASLMTTAFKLEELQQQQAQPQQQQQQARPQAAAAAMVGSEPQQLQRPPQPATATEQRSLPRPDELRRHRVPDLVWTGMFLDMVAPILLLMDLAMVNADC